MRKSSIGKWSVATIAVLLISSFAGGFFLQHQVTAKISHMDGFDIEEIDCSLLQNTIDLKKLNGNLEERTGLHGQVEAIEIKGLNRTQYLLNGSIWIDEVVVELADLYFDIARAKETLKRDSFSMPELYINELTLRNVNLHVLQDSNEIALIEDIAIRLQQLDFKTDADFSWKDYFLQTGLISFKIPNNYHQLNIGHAYYDPDYNKIELNGIHLYSDVSIQNWFETVSKKQCRYDFKSDKIKIDAPDLVSLVKQRELDINKIVVYNGALEVYEDHRFEHCQSCIKKLPHQSLLSSKKSISIDSVQFKNGFINYISKEVSKNELGSLTFSDFYASFYHLSNNKEEIKKQPTLLVDAQAAIFETTPIALHLEFDLSKSNGGYSYNGTVGGFDLVRLNDFLAPVMNVVVASGQSGNSTFYVKAPNRVAKGEMMFPYQNLQVKFLSENKDAKRFVSGLINGLAIKNNNLIGKKMRMGVIYHEDDLSRSFFHSLSNSLQSGIQSSAMAKYLLPDELRSIDADK